MTFTCRNICYAIGIGGLGRHQSPYKHGYGLCTGCRKYFDTISVNCPCCSQKLRRKPQCYKTKRKWALDNKYMDNIEPRIAYQLLLLNAPVENRL